MGLASFSAAPLLFVHGGPGLSSAAEEALLKPAFEAEGLGFECWNEPSHFRPEGEFFSPTRAFEAWVASVHRACAQLAFLKGPVHLVAHAFGAQAALLVAHQQPELFAGLTLVAPALDVPRLFERLEAVALEDFLKLDPVRATRLEAFLKAKRAFFDGADQQALGLAVTDPELLARCWAQPSTLVDFAQAWADRGAHLDGESFFAVCADFARTGGRVPFVGVPTQILWGKKDPLVTGSAERPLAVQQIADLHEVVFEESAHFPHLEERERFARLVVKPLWEGSEAAAERGSRQELDA